MYAKSKRSRRKEKISPYHFLRDVRGNVHSTYTRARSSSLSESLSQIIHKYLYMNSINTHNILYKI